MVACAVCCCLLFGSNLTVFTVFAAAKPQQTTTTTHSSLSIAQVDLPVTPSFVMSNIGHDPLTSCSHHAAINSICSLLGWKEQLLLFLQRHIQQSTSDVDHIQGSLFVRYVTWADFLYVSRCLSYDVSRSSFYCLKFS